MKQSSNKIIVAIDPGPEKSALILWDGKTILEMHFSNNIAILKMLWSYPRNQFDLVLEQVASMGMPVGASVFETVFWSGRFCQAWGEPFHRMKRGVVKMHLCGSMRAKDSNIIQALKDRFEPDLQPRQRPKTVLKGLSGDLWQAFALAITWWGKNEEPMR